MGREIGPGPALKLDSLGLKPIGILDRAAGPCPIAHRAFRGGFVPVNWFLRCFRWELDLRES